jgi:hypothetical protein
MDERAKAPPAEKVERQAGTEEKTVKVKMLNIATGDYGVYQPFQEYEIPAARAEAFIKAGNAERV